MDRLIYTALSGLQRATEAQAVTANNLANASVPGFRREMAALSPGWLGADGDNASLSARVQSGAESPHDLLNSGRVDTTGNPLDIAMNEGAWLAIVGADGQESLTRRGDLRVDAQGRLRTGDGRQLLGEDGPIQLAAGFAEVAIDTRGAIRTRVAADAPFVTVARLRLVSPDPASLSRQPDASFRTAEPLPADPTATVTTGALERSNVEPTAALIELIQQSRSFEMQTRLVTTARELDESAAALMRIE